MKTIEEILDKELDFLTIQKSIKDSRFTCEGMPANYSPYDVRAGARIMYDAMYGRIIKAMEAYASQQIEKYNELIEVMEEIIQYYQGGKMFDGFDIAFHELSKLKMKIKQLKTKSPFPSLPWEK